MERTRLNCVRILEISFFPFDILFRIWLHKVSLLLLLNVFTNCFFLILFLDIQYTFIHSTLNSINICKISTFIFVLFCSNSRNYFLFESKFNYNNNFSFTLNLYRCNSNISLKRWIHRGNKNSFGGLAW